MTVDKSLLAGSTTMLVLKLLDGQDMYGYQMIEELSRRSERARRYYHLERKGQHLLREKEVEWATFTTAVDRVLKGGVCLGSA